VGHLGPDDDGSDSRSADGPHYTSSAGAARRVITDANLGRDTNSRGASGEPRSARVVFVTHRFAHHAAPSGYDRLCDFISGGVIDATRWISLSRPIPDRIFIAIRRFSGVRNYTRERSIEEARAAVPFLLGPRSVFHFLYAENGYRFLGSLPNWRGHRIVATFHRPPSVLRDIIRTPAYLARLDHAIILGESQRSFLLPYLDATRITCIPYGVDTSYFAPADPDVRIHRCLFVGHYLRDFATFREAARQLGERAPDLRITVVTRPHFVHEFESLRNLEIRTNVADAELRTLYQTSSVLLLPLTDGVANTTILEAMACGLPVVSTAVGSVAEYVDADSGTLVPPGDPDALAAATLALLDDPRRLLRSSRLGRSRAIAEFDLSHVARRTEALLREVARR